ncbi:prepilin peptidase [Pseudofrankia inefficax]|uniref:Peptidase A24A prepilin type IV n=1 Tax=Pseudofrankia inefficax (strain DSM 45817 / CECT 9037 / DDB 130130 / EuI1c) TaxID=298654 RepID=E3J8Z3_PSEI1|nr:A24 family peptidase [Pseudofrankia inefficax]ADP79726.1 peptidase A24A prepilin type IV [Pseudofrankia inefficax]
MDYLGPGPAAGATGDGGWLFSVLYASWWGLVVAAVLATAAVVVAVRFGPELVGAFEPYEGESVRRGIPGRLTIGLVTAVAVVLVSEALRCSDLPALPAYLYLTDVGVVLAFVDARVHRLPDVIVLSSYPVLAALLVLGAVVDRLTWGFWGDGNWAIGAQLTGAAVGAAVPLLFFGLLHLIPRSGLGLGDVKLSGLLGAALGWTDEIYRVLLAVILGIFSAGLWAAFLLVTRRARRTDAIPYGPHLLLGAFLALLAGAVGS